MRTVASIPGDALDGLFIANARHWFSWVSAAAIMVGGKENGGPKTAALVLREITTIMNPFHSKAVASNRRGNVRAAGS
jgi:hypothetical protein